MNLQIENLSFRYAQRAPEVLADVNLNFESGEVVGLLGPNGAGKSTLLYLISGVLTPLSGKVTYDGISTRLRRPSVLSEIYLVSEEVQLPRMSLKKYVDLYSKFYPRFDKNVMETALKEFEMDSPERMDSLSMGQKKKIVLSFAFACNTSVTLFDEPTNGLDIPGKAAFRRLVARMADENRLFIISTHQIRDLDTILDRVMIMDEHRFVFNRHLTEIQERLAFFNGASSMPENAIYSLPSVGGIDYVTVKSLGHDTEVNLELLFGAVMHNPELVNQLMNETNNEI